jgi:hypothetical protein
MYANVRAEADAEHCLLSDGYNPFIRNITVTQATRPPGKSSGVITVYVIKVIHIAMSKKKPLSCAMLYKHTFII